jgi:transposase
MTTTTTDQRDRCNTGNCYMAIELSDASWLIGIMTPLSDRISLRKIAAGAVSQLLATVDKVIDTVSQATGRAPRVISCYEAGRDGFWLHRVLEARGITNHVIDAASLLVNRRARRAKTDRLDAEKMIRTLLALARGEPKVCSIVRVPSIAEEDAKRLHREHQFLMKERIQHIGRIKGLLAAQGCVTSGQAVRTGQGSLRKP